MNTKQALIKTNSKNFFKHWLILTKPLHKLKSQEINVLALLLYNYFELKKQITNDDLSWKLTFDYDTKLKIRTELNIIEASFNNVIYSLRKKKIITEGKINKSFVPILNLESSNTYSLIFKFEIVND
jgi:hypothetical protein